MTETCGGWRTTGAGAGADGTGNVGATGPAIAPPRKACQASRRRPSQSCFSLSPAIAILGRFLLGLELALQRRRDGDRHDLSRMFAASHVQPDFARPQDAQGDDKGHEII